jgi:acetoin utilization protein AcuC
MSDRVGIVWDERLAAYDFGPGHPLTPQRVQLAMRLMTELGLCNLPNVEVLSRVDPATEADLLRVHDADFIEAVRAASLPGARGDLARGLGTADVPTFSGMHDAATLVCGATLAAARAVHSGSVEHAVNLGGGLHHAMRDRAGGFCVYNDIAVAIGWLLEQGVERIAYIDVDVHHGDGVQSIFYDDPRVLTISVHEDPRILYPFTGFPGETGGPHAPGSAVNIALPRATTDQAWLRAFHAVVPELLEDFAPQIIVSQQGCDSHALDPLATMQLSIDGQRMSYQAIHRWAHRYAGGRWVAVGGGGYAAVDVVPRAWTHLVAEVIGHPIAPDTELPVAYRDHVREVTGKTSPKLMTDGKNPWVKAPELGFDPKDPTDAAILATRAAVFPLRGLPVDPPGFL